MKLLSLVGSLVLAASLTPALAQTNATANPAPPGAGQPGAPVPAMPKLMIFHPPTDVTGDVMPTRVGGGSRTGPALGLFLTVLVPEQIALTTQAQPSLYWYQSKEAKTQFEVTVTEPKNPKPLLALKSGSQTPAGIHAIRLSKFDVNLKPNVLYRWSVAVVVDPADRSQDVIATGVIKRIDPSSDLASKLAQASDSDKAALYAENGIWYDALQSISDQIDKSPKDAALHQERADLLKQVGMDDVAVSDLSKSP